MKSIEKLRTTARNMAKGRNLENHEECNLLLIIADEIEAEADSDYMKLPRLDDGVINVGDWIESDYEEIKCVREVEALIWDGERWDFQFSDEDGDTRDCASIYDFYEKSKHVAKPNPLNDLLHDVSGGVLGYPRYRIARYLEDNHSIGEAVLLDVRDRLRVMAEGSDD